MKLSDWMHQRRLKRTQLAKLLGVSYHWTCQVVKKNVCSPRLALHIEYLTDGAVKRKDMRRDKRMVNVKKILERFDALEDFEKEKLRMEILRKTVK